MLAVLASLPQAGFAGEGGTSHVLPGATATLADLPGTSAASFFKPMYLNYSGSVSATIPTAAGLAGNMDATANTLALAIGMTFEQTVLGGAHYTFAFAQPFASLDVSADVKLPNGGTVARKNSVSGLGDSAELPVMLAWKTGNWQIDAMLHVGYAMNTVRQPWLQ